MKFAIEFNRRFQLLMKLSLAGATVADNPKVWKSLSKINNDCYEEAMAGSIER
jgi:hypothetical protein